MKPENKEVVIVTMGEKLLKLRKARQWSQEELAERIGVTRQAVSRWESGSAKPDADKIVAICDLFGVSADYLLRESYQGEAAFTAVQPQSTALGNAVRNMTLGQWGALAAFLGGGAMMFILKLIYIFKNTNYYYQDVLGRNYTGFDAFLRTESIHGFWLAGMLAALGGGCFIFLPLIHKFFRDKIWKKIGDFFNWD